jgi:rSAM/selenodomain-associated transferase 2
MSMKPLSIVIPVLNDAPALQRLLAQLQPARHTLAQVIVVDGGSTDGVEAVCQGKVDHFVVSRPGRAAQMNTGAVGATGHALWFVHADSQLPEDAAAHVLYALQDRLWGRFDVALVGKSRWLPVIAAAMNTRSRWTDIATGDQGIFMRTEVFNQLAGYADLPLMEDIDLSRRARRMGPPACLRVRITTSGRRWDTHGVLRTILLMWWLRLRFWLGADAHVLHALYYPQQHQPQRNT